MVDTESAMIDRAFVARDAKAVDAVGGIDGRTLGMTPVHE
jgi:hypothetical protein